MFEGPDFSYRENAKPRIELVSTKAQNWVQRVLFEFGALVCFFKNWGRYRKIPTYRIVRTLYILSKKNVL